MGHKGIDENQQSDFDIDYHDFFLKELKGPSFTAKLAEEPRYNEELKQFVDNDFILIFPLIYRKELVGFITLGDKMDKKDYSSEEISSIAQLNKIIASSLYIINSGYEFKTSHFEEAKQ